MMSADSADSGPLAPEVGEGQPGASPGEGPGRAMLVALHEVAMELATIGTVDALCRRAVELGCSRLGFDRLSIWFLGEDGCSVEGTYGIDESGQVRSEHGARYRFDSDSTTAEALRSRLRWARRDDAELMDHLMRPLGKGTYGVSVLWSSEGALGVMFVDNYRFRRPITDAQFELLALYGGTLGHLIARLRAEEALRESQARVASILRSAPIGIGLVIDDVIVEANDHLCDMVGLPRGEVIGRDHRLWFPSTQEYERVERLLRRQLTKRGVSDRIETRLVRGNGEAIDVSLSAALISPGDLDGGITFTVRDITARQLAQRRIRESEERYRAVFEASPSGIVVLSPKGEFITVNPMAEEALGYTSDELRGRLIWDLGLLSPDDVDRLVEALAQRLEGRVLPAYNLTINHKDGSTRTVSLVGSVVRDAEGRPTEVHYMITDVTELMALQARAEQGRKLESLAAMAGGIAHDFNNILTAILGNVELARLALAQGSEAGRFIDQIEQGARRAAELAAKMLAYSGRAGLAREETDLSALVEGAVTALEAAIPSAVRLRLDLARELPAVVVDPGQLREAVASLLANAVEAIGDEPGEVAVRTYLSTVSAEQLARTYVDDGLPGGDYVTLEVSDTGHGVDEDTLARMFEPFYTTRFLGRGLGLAEVLGIVRGHNGAISVRSTPGAGTTLSVLLPVAGRPSDEQATGS